MSSSFSERRLPAARPALAALTLLLAACGGGQGSLPASPANGANGDALDAGRKAKLEVRLTVPKRDRREHYISPSTRSIVILEGALKIGTFNVTPSSPGCAAQDGFTVCRFAVGTKTGSNVTIAVSTYDAPDGAGNTLSTGHVTLSIVPGLNIVPITLSGIVTSIALALQGPNPPAGSAARVPVTVMAKDADGNVIIGPGRYAAPITLSDSDTSGITALSTKNVASPNVDVTLAYTGGPLTRATIGAASNDVVAAPAIFAPAPYVANDFYLPPGSFSTNAIEATAIAAGADGNLWIGVCCTSDTGIVVMDTSGDIINYYTSGKAPSTALPQVAITGMVKGPDGNVWYAAGANVGSIGVAGTVANYALTGGGVCAGAFGERLVPSADGGLWLTIRCTSGSQVAHVTTTGIITYYTIAGLSNAAGLVLGKDGNLYIAGSDAGTGEGTVVQADVSAGAIVASSFADVPSYAGSLLGVAQTPDGDFWATTDNCGTSALVRFHAASPFAASAVTTFVTPAGCSEPAYPTALADGSLWVPESKYAIATRAIVNTYPAAPSLFDLPLLAYDGVAPQEWDSAVGPDGNLYIVDRTYNGEVVQVVY